LPAGFLTPNHALIRWNGIGWVLTPTAFGGVLSNGYPVEQVLLTNGMKVQLADRLGNIAELTALLGGSGAVVHELRGPIPGPMTSITIGSDPSSTIQLHHPMVRSEHAILHRDGSGVLAIEDRASVANTYVNGTRIKRKQILNVGDIVQIGPFSARVGMAALEPLPQVPGVAIDVYAAQVTVPQKGGGQRHLLHDVNLAIKPATMTVVAGPSGAGKTTLMRLLAGQTVPAGGLITYDGDNLSQARSRYETTMGFVPQDDIVHTELTVREALSFQARLRLGEDHPAEDRAEEVVKAITFVGLEAQADQIISTLSGGQRKRVSVATELLNDPKLIFLDEPTSGLDPGLDKRMMLLLRLLADQGRTVILTTHAIAHVDVADQLLLVGPGGWVIYAGPPQEACEWFGVETLADVFALVEDPVASQAAAQRIPTPVPAEPVHREVAIHTPRPTSRSAGRGQLALFTRRQLVIMRRDPTALLVQLASGAAVALIVWLLLTVIGTIGKNELQWWRYKGAPSISIIFGCASVWFGALASVRELVKERPIWRRESLVGANAASYLGSKLLILLMIGAVQASSITVIVSIAFSPTPSSAMPFALCFLITMLLGYLAGAGLGLIISALAPSSDRAQSLVPNLLILQFIFSGAAIKLGSPVVWSIGNFIPTRWVVGAIDDLGDQINCNDYHKPSPNRCPPDPTNHSQTLSPSILDVTVTAPLAWLALTLIIVGSSAIVLNLLRRQARSWSIG
jgi:ABC-type branched-subunit amino acid transport system ATPase component